LAQSRYRRVVDSEGELQDGEDPAVAARREFAEELGVEATGLLVPLGQIRQRGGKTVLGYALQGEFDISTLRSNDVAIEWPPRSGRTEYFPEIDRAAWFSLPLARQKILAGQLPFLDRLEMLCSG